MPTIAPIATASLHEKRARLGQLKRQLSAGARHLSPEARGALADKILDAARRWCREDREFARWVRQLGVGLR